MDVLPLLCAVAVAFTGLTRGAGVLPDALLNAAVGETVMFTTTVTLPETSLLTVRWKFGDKEIIYFSLNNFTSPEYEGRITLFISTGSLELRSLTHNDSGEYSVSIAIIGELPKEGTTRLSVHELVSDVMANASSTDLEEDSSVRLSCSSSGSSLSFLWLNSSSEVTASDRVQLTDGGSTLTINVTRYDQGPFSCRVSNPVSTATSSQIQLSISYGPENINLISPSPEYYAEGSDIILSCSADSRPAPHFTWLLNGDLQKDTGADLRLMNIQMSQSGNYSCRAFNSKTLIRETSPPSVVSVLKKITGASITSKTNGSIEGNSFNLSCDAAGFVFKREWRKGDVVLTPDDNMQLYDKDRVLSFNSLSKDDAGDYVCNVSNPVNHVEAKYKVFVFYGPEHVKIHGPSEIYLNGTLKLICSAESEPAAYTWTLNGTKIHNSSVIFKTNTNYSLSGNYICEVMNHMTGKTSSAAHLLSVKAQPITPQGISDGHIAGIVIAVLVVFGGLCGGYYVYHTKKQRHKLSVRTPPTGTGAEGQDNKAYAGTQVKGVELCRYQYFPEKRWWKSAAGVAE
ncbi:carcinoembryonic antigen-related cell adhesion molecule 5-like isoform X2 [Cyclopterus lumpus]|uniref:carcinoembryonic antigen-related cell adhesion molecule 5-like isoform X2 n=1 Tax=Cyclopterus lumpus TaxID=8103 RepID=UPI0014865002|nr:carcinoembryonic antigen-related cell adhesion molecule 5-like isoform X2 [Cyclopterus lumpus]